MFAIYFPRLKSRLTYVWITDAESYPHSDRRGAFGVLLIRVLAAHNLVNADWFSLSDPYAKAPTGIDLVDLYRWFLWWCLGWWRRWWLQCFVSTVGKKRNKHHIHYDIESSHIYIYFIIFLCNNSTLQCFRCFSLILVLSCLFSDPIPNRSHKKVQRLRLRRSCSRTESPMTMKHIFFYFFLPCFF